MRKFSRILGIVAVALVGLFVLLFVVAKLISDEQYKEWITTGVKSATGRDLAIEELELDLNSSLLVKARNVNLANADWSSRPEMLSVGEFEAELNLLALLGGVADIRTIIDKADVLVESNADNISNWALGKPKEAAEKDTTTEDADSGGLPIRPYIREIRVQGFELSLLDKTGSEKTARVENLLIETAQNELTLDISGAYETTAITLNGNLGEFAEVLEGASTPMVLNGNVGPNSVVISGDWGPLLPDVTADLKLAVDIPSTSGLSDIAGMEIGDLGALDLNAVLKAAENRYALTELNAKLQGEHAAVTVDGGVEDLATLTGVELEAHADTSALTALLKKFNLELPVHVPPDLTVSARASGELEKLAVKDIDIKALDEGIQIHVSGDIGHALGPEEVDVQIQANVASIASLSKYARLDLPELGEINISGKVLSSNTTYRLDDLKANMTGEDIQVQVSGGVQDLLAVSGVDAVIQMEAGPFSPSTISKIEQLLEQQALDFPLLLPNTIMMSSRMAGNTDQLSATEINVEVLDKGIELKLSGAVANALAPEGVDATVDLKLETLAALSKYTQPFTQFKLPERGALDLSGHILSGNETYRLEDFKTTLNDSEFNAEIQASIEDLLAMTGIKADLKADVTSLSALSDLAQTELPATDAVRVTGKVSAGEDEQNRQTSIAVNAESGGATIQLEGNMADLKSLEEIDVELAVNATSLDDFSKFARTALPQKGPFSLTGTFHRTSNEYRLEDLQMRLDKQSLNGSAAFRKAEGEEEISSIDAQLNVPLLDLSPLVTSDPETAQAAETPEPAADSKLATKEIKEDEEREQMQEEAEADDKLFPSDPLAVDQLHNYNADVTLTADRIILGKVNMSDVDIQASLKDGLLQVQPIKAIAGNGTIDGQLKLDAQTTPADLVVDVKIKNAPMPRLGGGLDFNLDVEGTGASIAEIMAGLNGQILIVMRDGRLEDSMMTNFGSGLMSNMNPFAEEEPYTDIECGILRVDIKDGIADFQRKMAMQLTKVTWRGGGDINLKTEELDVGIVPKPRTGIPISAGSLASLVHVGGTLKKPKVQLDPKDVAMKYGKYMAALGTGGLTVLAEMLVNKTQANVDVCAKILDGTVFDEESPTEGSAAEQDLPSGAAAEDEQEATTGQAVQTGTVEPEAAVDQAPNIEKEPAKEDTAPKSKNLQ